MDSSFFKGNRERLITALKGGVIVVSAHHEMQRMADMAFAFEQEANFWWLSGVEAPDWRLIIDGTRGKSYLIAPEVDPVYQLFNGSLSADAAAEVSGVDGILEWREGDAMLRQLARKHSVVYALGDEAEAKSYGFVLNPAAHELWQQLERIFHTVQDCHKELAALRAIKQEAEVVSIEQAIRVTERAFEQVRTKLSELHYEYEIEAEFTHYFRTHGAKGHAYDPIVAAGDHACTLHYTANNGRLAKRQLVLMDIGARVQGYAADITRTYEVGAATSRQRAVHAAVEEAQRQIIKLLAPELPLVEYQTQVDEIMTRQLIGLGLITSASDEKYRTYFPHAVSHGLGIDVHDHLGRPRYLQPGMVLTVEPGIYIPEEGIGVRIEDDILITSSGNRNLSGHLSTAIR